jgi:hypothetical protein
MGFEPISSFDLASQNVGVRVEPHPRTRIIAVRFAVGPIGEEAFEGRPVGTSEDRGVRDQGVPIGVAQINALSIVLIDHIPEPAEQVRVVTQLFGGGDDSRVIEDRHRRAELEAAHHRAGGEDEVEGAGRHKLGGHEPTRFEAGG